MAFVVILHLSPKHESNAAEILQRATRLPVRQVSDATAIEVDHVYVIPPGVELTMDDGHLRVTPSARVRAGTWRSTCSSAPGRSAPPSARSAS
jgi:two-component system CheB/CheR fusion protein